MMNKNKHINFWRDSSVEDLEVAEQLVNNGKTRHGLFFGHLALEKLLKGLIVKGTADHLREFTILSGLQR